MVNIRDKSYCVLAIQKIKTMGGLQRRYEHNFRLEDVPNALVENDEENEELIDLSGMDYRDLWYRRIKDVEIQTGRSVAVRKNTSVLAYEIVTTFSRNADVDIEAWKNANVQWMKDTFGEDNVLSMQLHRDEEGCEHIHSIVVPIDERGHLCAKSFTGTRGKMFALHNSYSKAMAPLGLSRGEMFSRAKKQDLRRFYGAVNEAAQATVPEIQEGEMIDHYVDRVNDYLQTVCLAHLKEKEDLKRRAELAETQHLQTHARYSEAMALYDMLLFQYDGDEKEAKKRLKMYQKIEETVPERTLSTLIKGIVERFPTKQKKFEEYKRKSSLMMSLSSSTQNEER